LILVVGTKLHRVVVKLALEVRDSDHLTDFGRFNLRDELFWFGKPRLLLRLIQFVSFQNAFEMAMYIWSMWEIKEPSCFTGDRSTLVIRLSFGVVSQFWCSFITFPLYVIVAQMGSKFKKTIVSENVRRSLHGWRRKVKTRRRGGGARFSTTSGEGGRRSSSSSLIDDGWFVESYLVSQSRLVSIRIRHGARGAFVFFAADDIRVVFTLGIVLTAC
ncbi:hypothetical protein M569_08264, partial [Genlisea aurea]